MTRTMLFALLAVVAGAAAVLSFAALRDLALKCGFGSQLAWLLPLVIDAGAAAGSLAWLSSPAGRARAFGRRLALVLLATSVLGNAIGHALEAYSARPAWGLVVAVSGLAPAVLAAVVHLTVLAVQRQPAPLLLPVETPGDDPRHPVYPDPDLVDEHGLSRSWETAPPADDRAAALIASGAGRRRLARELDISEHQARELLAASRNGVAVR